MNKYNEMSDGIINAELTEIILGLKSWEFNEVTRMFYHCGVDGNGHYENAVIDFVNSPADMWPIIVENKISLHFNWSECGLYTAIGTLWEDRLLGKHPKTFEVSHENPLRAAAIVFLMMKDAK